MPLAPFFEQKRTHASRTKLAWVENLTTKSFAVNVFIPLFLGFVKKKLDEHLCTKGKKMEIIGAIIGMSILGWLCKDMKEKPAPGASKNAPTPDQGMIWGGNDYLFQATGGDPSGMPDDMTTEDMDRFMSQ